MKIMRVVELNLIADKERLEYHLEETINRKDMDASEKIIVIKETLLELTETINIIQLWSSYIEGLEKNNKVVEGK
jgi:ParB-like chromosome segregation protein Spo0J